MAHPSDDPFQVVFQAPLREPLREWLQQRGLDMAKIPGDDDGLETMVVVIPPGSPLERFLRA